jgi:sialic acid synthase SpsE
MHTDIIAEIGQNHNGDMALAADLIRLARDNGADTAKFQVYDAKALFPKEGNPWYDYNCRTELTRAQVDFLASECRKAGIEFMASVFDVERIAWLETAGVKRYKLASRSVRDQKLIGALAETGKPLIVSLGMWGEPAFPAIRHPRPVQFLYCVSKYPTQPEDLKLAQVDFRKYAGFSDHTIGIAAPLAAIARGAGIIEKHFTSDKSLYGPDHEGSMLPGELRQLRDFGSVIERSL